MAQASLPRLADVLIEIREQLTGGLGEAGAGLPVAPIARANREEFLCRDHDLLC
jgi:hypothetical protein